MIFTTFHLGREGVHSSLLFNFPSEGALLGTLSSIIPSSWSLFLFFLFFGWSSIPLLEGRVGTSFPGSDRSFLGAGPSSRLKAPNG